MMKMLIPILGILLLSGCNEPKQVSGADFQHELDLRNAQTMVASEYLGEKDGKVFLRRKTMSLIDQKKWSEEIWFTEKNNLDDSFIERLRMEADPNQKPEPAR